MCIKLDNKRGKTSASDNGIPATDDNKWRDFFNNQLIIKLLKVFSSINIHIQLIFCNVLIFIPITTATIWQP